MVATMAEDPETLWGMIAPGHCCGQARRVQARCLRAVAGRQVAISNGCIAQHAAPTCCTQEAGLVAGNEAVHDTAAPDISVICGGTRRRGAFGGRRPALHLFSWPGEPLLVGSRMGSFVLR